MGIRIKGGQTLSKPTYEIRREGDFVGDNDDCPCIVRTDDLDDKIAILCTMTLAEKVLAMLNKEGDN
jgi:ferredoxin-thioredoxin reductase catalytic subunit